MEEIEIWKDIPEYENKYQASNFGNIKSLNFNNTKKESFLQQITDKYNRRQVTLWKGNKSKTFRVHQLVAITFLGHIPDKTFKIVVDHKDNNSLNNRLDNLQLVTNRFNTSKDQKSKGRSSKYIGVTWDKKNNKWLSQIRIGGKSKNLGRYIDEDEAGKAYQNKLATLN